MWSRILGILLVSISTSAWAAQSHPMTPREAKVIFSIIGAIFLLSLIFVGSIVYPKYKAWKKAAAARAQALKQVAEELGFTYRPGPDKELPRRYEFLSRINRKNEAPSFIYLVGRKGLTVNAKPENDSTASDILEGVREGWPVCFFTHTCRMFKSENGRAQYHVYVASFLALEYARILPDLCIEPRATATDTAGTVEFEVGDFSRVFIVKSDDRQFAYDFCHEEMMDFLIAHQNLTIEIRQNYIFLCFEPPCEPESIPGYLAQLMEITNMLHVRITGITSE